MFGYRKAFIYPERVFIPEIQTKLNAQGRIVDREILGRLQSQAKGFIDFAERLDGVKLREICESGERSIKEKRPVQLAPLTL
jgi:hypothetical protein